MAATKKTAEHIQVNDVTPRDDLGFIHPKHYPTYYKGLSETDPREALECARRLKVLGYTEHAKHVVERFRKVKNVGPAPSANPPDETPAKE